MRTQRDAGEARQDIVRDPVGKLSYQALLTPSTLSLAVWQLLPIIGMHGTVPGEKKGGGTAMQTMNISLPDTMKHFIDAQVAAGGYSSASEYVRALVRDAQQRQAKARLETLLLEALDSGDPTVMSKEDWDTIRREGLARLRTYPAAPHAESP